MKKRIKKVKDLNYGVIHSQIDYSDGVSIVINQIEEIMGGNLQIPRSNIHYLVGKAKKKSPYVRQKKVFWHKSKTNKLVNKKFKKGLNHIYKKTVENSIKKAKEEIRNFVKDKKLDVIIAHNSCHPMNFVYSVALSRYFEEEKSKNKKIPKYIVWWHDSHLERQRYNNPSKDIKEYLIEGIPGKHVDYIIFINKMQFNIAKKYFHEVDKKNKGFFKKMFNNRTVIHNTVSTPINSIRDLNKVEFGARTQVFLSEMKINKIMKKNNLKLDDILFCLQHTRIVKRKRIDFALEYAYELFSNLERKKEKKAMVFVVSGSSGDENGNHKKKLIKLNKKLSKKYKTKKFFLKFVEDYKTSIPFEEIPLVISNLKGIATFFSEYEGFGNNLLEILSAGLIPIVYTYPVFVKDIKEYDFNIITLSKFRVTQTSINKMVRLTKNEKLKEKYGNKNIKILKKKLPHATIAPKLQRAIRKCFEEE